jgi:hypothetical protein
VVDLAADYYLTNFKTLMRFVFEHYEDLLSECELNFYDRFNELSSDSQKLLVRMLLRKGNYFRQDKLIYSEIESPTLAASQLAEFSLIGINQVNEVVEAMSLLTKPQWITQLKKLDYDSKFIAELKKLKRQSFDNELCILAVDNNLFEDLDFEIYRLLCSDVFQVYQLLFFGNLYQDMTDFVLNDLGLFRYEDYIIDHSSRLFESRQQINDYINYYQQLEHLETILQQPCDDIVVFANQLPQPSSTDSVLNRRVERVKIELARQLERLKCYQQAIEIYQTCHRHPARERRARILATTNDIDACLSLCQSIIQSPYSEEESLFAQEFSSRIAKKHKIPWAVTDFYQPPKHIITLDKPSINDLFQSVEDNSAKYFQQFGQCLSTENRLFNSLFTLVYWDVLYAPVRGAFTHPFQHRPHDLYESDFLLRRQALFDQANELLTNKSALSLHCKQLLADKQGISSYTIDWSLMDGSLIDLAVERIPLTDMHAIFQRMWLDIRHNRAGFPDLILFPNQGGYRLIEIKGPGDRLQKNQIRWMRFFRQHNIEHQVVHVEWSE